MVDNGPQPRVRLSKLRDIGWRLWDPIGLLGPSQRWQDPANQGFADEYDRYLIDAASQLRRGVEHTQVVDYLVMIEVDHMGIGEGSATTRDRAKAVVDAILADDSI